MAKFLPKAVSEEDWKPLKADRSYAVRCQNEDEIHLRLGSGVGLYLALSHKKPEGLVMNNVTYENGELSLVGPLPAGQTICLGRAEDCLMKIRHAIVSRKHAEFHLDGTIIVIKDLGSTNGTSVHKDNTFFDIEEYLVNHPVSKKAESTLDWIHEMFGPTLDDFLLRYQKEKTG